MPCPTHLCTLRTESDATANTTHLQTDAHLSLLRLTRTYQAASEMFKFISLLVLGLCEGLSGGRFERSINRLYRSRLQVNNGMRWGSWGQKEICPAGTYAAGFSLKVEHHQGKGILAGDDTALNGIRLHCISPLRSSLYLYGDYATVQSDTGSWGQWTDIKWCSGGFLTSFQLRVEPYQGGLDDTAANNIRFTCSGTDRVLEGSGTSWGDWGDWSDKCHGKGICGIKTKVDVPQGVKDDTALNDVRMYCCD